jgi:6 kDa early secretory antigenic target
LTHLPTLPVLRCVCRRQRWYGYNRARGVRRAEPGSPPGSGTEVTISGSIRVTLPVVASAEEQFRQALYALEAQLDQLDTELRSSLAEWTGEAQAAYQAAHAQWQAAAGDMAKSLAWLHGVIGTAHQNYDSARATNVGIWRGSR